MTNPNQFKPGESLEVMRRSRKHNRGHRKHRDHRQRPCGSPPAQPSGVVLSFQATEARTHLRFTGKVKWNEVEFDEGGTRTKVKRYEVRMRATDSGGTPVESEDAVTRMRAMVKFDPTRIPISDAEITSGTIAEFTTTRNHHRSAGDVVVVKGMKPIAYNGTWTVLAAGLAAKTFRADIGASPADSTDGGQFYEDIDRFYVISRELPRPRKWYWQASVRAIDNDDCAGDWSAWTAPGLPWTGADPEPPAPTYGGTPITFDRIGRGKRRKLRLKFTFNEVVNWDVPGGDDEPDMRSYVVVVDRSDDGLTWDGTPWYRKKIVAAKQDDDADTTRTVHFIVEPRQWYRVKVKSIDRYNRHGDFSAFTSATWPGDTTQPPTPLLVRIFETATNRVAVDWDAPTADYPTKGTVSGTSGTATVTGSGTAFLKEVEAGSFVKISGNTYKVLRVTSDTALTLTTNLSTSPSGVVMYEIDEHFDVAGYQVQIAKASTVDTAPTPDEWSDIYMRDRTSGTRRSFKVAEADEGDPFFGRVRAYDAAMNRSRWVYATHAGNSDPDVSGQNSLVGAGGGVVVATFTKPGRLRSRHYPYRWTNNTGRTLTFKRARAVIGIHDSGTHPNDGCPRGGDVKMNLRLWHDDETHYPVFDNGVGGDDDERLIIEANTHKDSAPVSTFDLTELEEEQALSVKVTATGTDYAGEDLVVQVFMD